MHVLHFTSNALSKCRYWVNFRIESRSSPTQFAICLHVNINIFPPFTSNYHKTLNSFSLSRPSRGAVHIYHSLFQWRCAQQSNRFMSSLHTNLHSLDIYVHKLQLHYNSQLSDELRVNEHWRESLNGPQWDNPSLVYHWMQIMACKEEKVLDSKSKDVGTRNRKGNTGVFVVIHEES